MDGSGGKGTSGWNSESDVPEYSEPDTYRNREEGKAKNSSKATVSPVVAICRSCCISFRLYDFVHLYLNLADKTENYSSQTYKVLVDKGQRASVILPDGTKVWLNSHTELTYNGDYGKGNRQVVLSGEGYFEVAKDSTSRFVVKAGEMEVERWVRLSI